MFYYDYAAFEDDMRQMLFAVRDYAPDTLIALSRGGLMGTQLLAYGLDVRNIELLRVESYDAQQRRDGVNIGGHCDVRDALRILIVDDIVDSGKTLEAVVRHLRHQTETAQIKCAAPWYKKTASVQPDFTCREATEWIEFFWDRFGA